MWVIYSYFGMESLEDKQKYLREHILQSQYEEFSAYLEEHVGNEDIQRWSKEFLVEIVDDFLKMHQEDSSALETSFYVYQHASALQEPASPNKNHDPKVKNEPNRQLQEQPKTKQQPPKPVQELNVSKAETSSIEVKSKSALNLFDSVFETSNKSNKNIPAKLEPPKAVSSKPLDASKFSAFDSNDFWGSAGLNKNIQSPTSKNSNNKLSKSNVDFTSFDFWAQPQTKSVHEFKSITIEPPLSIKPQPPPPTSHKNNESAIPSFDELLQRMKEEIKEDKKQQKKEEKREQRKQKEVKAPSPYQKKSYHEERVATPVISLNKVSYDGPVVLKSDFKDTVKCFPSAERQEFKGKELSVAIEGHEIVNRTFLMPDYVMYSIRVQPINVVIQRNYEDFSRLRAVLADFYPGTKLAYLEATSWFGATSPEQIKRQKMMLEYFLNDLLRNKEVRNSRFLEDFLTLPEHKKIKRKFQQFQRLERPKSIEELCLLQGKVQVNLSEQQRQYQEHLKKYQERMVDFLQRQERLNQVLAEQYKAVAGTLQSLIDLTTTIIDQTRRFNERVFGLQIDGADEVFKLMRGCYAEERKLAVFNMDLANTSHIPFLSYQRANTKELDEIIATQQAFLRSYLKRTQTEKIDPSIPYTSDKLTYSKVSVGVESKNLIVLKYQAGFFGNQLCNEAKRIFQGLAMKFRELWARTGLRKQEQCIRSLDFWRTLAAPLPS